MTDKFFGFYKTANILVKILLFWLLLIFCILWVIGSWTKWDRLVMFIVGALVAAILVLIFHQYITPGWDAFVQWWHDAFRAIGDFFSGLGA